jgi:hypothetical protein
VKYLQNNPIYHPSHGVLLQIPPNPLWVGSDEKILCILQTLSGTMEKRDPIHRGLGPRRLMLMWTRRLVSKNRLFEKCIHSSHISPQQSLGLETFSLERQVATVGLFRTNFI